MNVGQKIKIKRICGEVFHNHTTRKMLFRNQFLATKWNCY